MSSESVDFHPATSATRKAEYLLAHTPTIVFQKILLTKNEVDQYIGKFGIQQTNHRENTYQHQRKALMFMIINLICHIDFCCEQDYVAI
jgi:hypothetical protein